MSGGDPRLAIHEVIPNLTDHEIDKALALVDKQQHSDLLIQILGLDGARIVPNKKGSA